MNGRNTRNPRSGRKERRKVGLYRKLIVPRLCDLARRNERLAPYRARTIGAAQGRVLEIGAGSGLNLRAYPRTVDEIIALEPDPELIRMAGYKLPMPTCSVSYLEASAERIPLEDASIDTVVSTWTMCTIPDIQRALEEIRRVIKPRGRLLFIEHGLAPEPRVRNWQNRLDPLWNKASGGCHLNRPIEALIAGAGFAIEHLQTGYMAGPKLMTFMYEGAARPQ